MSRLKTLGAPAWLLIVAMLAHFILFVRFGLAEHDSLRTFYDLTDLSQPTWNTLQGRPFALSNTGGVSSRLGIHVEFIILLAAPFYLLYSDARTLIVLQTVCLTLAAWPMYLLAKDIFVGQSAHPSTALRSAQDATTTLRSAQDATTARRSAQEASPLRAWAALVIALMYLWHPAVGGSSTQLLNFVVWATPSLTAAFWLLRRRRFGWFWLFAVLVMMCKEDVPLLIAMLGVYTIVVLRAWRQGLAIIVVSLAYFYIANYVILRIFSPEGQSIFIERYGALGGTLTQVILSPLTKPLEFLRVVLRERNFIYLWHTFASTGFVNALDPMTLIVSLPTLAINLLSAFPNNQEPDIYYTVPLVPFWLAGTAIGIMRLAHWVGRRAWLSESSALRLLCAGVMASAFANHLAVGHSPIGGYFIPPEVTAHTLRVETFVAQIPPNAAVAAPPLLNPHLSTREKLYIYPHSEGVEYILLDVVSEKDFHPNDFRGQINELLAKDFGIVSAADGYLLLRRGASNKTLPDAFYDFARATNPQPQVRTDITFGDALKLIGYDVVGIPRDMAEPGVRRVKARFYWQALRPIEQELRLYPFYADAGGRIIEDTSTRVMIATVWYPPKQWRADEIIVTEMWPWDVGEKFQLGVGVIEGRDWNARGRRLRASGGESPDGTWAALGAWRWEGRQVVGR